MLLFLFVLDLNVFKCLVLVIYLFEQFLRKNIIHRFIAFFQELKKDSIKKVCKDILQCLLVLQFIKDHLQLFDVALRTAVKVSFNFVILV